MPPQPSERTARELQKGGDIRPNEVVVCLRDKQLTNERWECERMRASGFRPQAQDEAGACAILVIVRHEHFTCKLGRNTNHTCE